MATVEFPTTEEGGGPLIAHMSTYTEGDTTWIYRGTSGGSPVWDLQGTSVARGVEIGFSPPGHEDHSGGENDGEIILGDTDGNILSALPVDVRANTTIIPDDNGLVGTDNGRLVFNISTEVQAGDERPVNSAAVFTALSTIPVSGDLVTFKDLTADTPTAYRLDAIEYNTQNDGHLHDFLFQFENDSGAIGMSGFQTQAPISDGRPATNANFTDDSDTNRYATVATVKHWARNEFLEDSQLLLSSDSSDTATVTGIAEVPTADWLNNVWKPAFIPAGTTPANWSDVGGGTDIPAYSSSATYVAGNFVYNPVNGIIYRSLGTHAAGSSLVNPNLWQSLGGATQFAPIATTAQNLSAINIPNNTVGAELQLSSNNVETGLGTPNDETKFFGTGGVTVTAHGSEDIIVIDGSGAGDGEALAEEIAARIEGDEEEREYVDNLLTRLGTPSQAYYQFNGVPETFADSPTESSASTIAFAPDILPVKKLFQSDTLFSPIKTEKLTLRYDDGGLPPGNDFNKTGSYVVALSGIHHFAIITEHQTVLFDLPVGVNPRSVTASHFNFNSANIADNKIWFGTEYQQIVEVPLELLLNTDATIKPYRNLSFDDIEIYAPPELSTGYSEISAVLFDNSTTNGGFLFAGNGDGDLVRLSRGEERTYTSLGSFPIDQTFNYNEGRDGTNVSVVGNLTTLNVGSYFEWEGVRRYVVGDIQYSTFQMFVGDTLTTFHATSFNVRPNITPDIPYQTQIEIFRAVDHLDTSYPFSLAGPTGTAIDAEQFGSYRDPSNTHNVGHFRIRGIKRFTLSSAMATSATRSGLETPSWGITDRMLIVFGDSTTSANGVTIPGIALGRNLETSTTLSGAHLTVPGGGLNPNDDYSSFFGNPRILDVAYGKNAKLGEAEYEMVFVGENLDTAGADQAVIVYGTSVYGLNNIQSDVSVEFARPINTVSLGFDLDGNIDPGEGYERWWMSTGFGAVWVLPDFKTTASYTPATLLQFTNDAGDVVNDFSMQGFYYGGRDSSLGMGTDGHVYRYIRRPLVTFGIEYNDLIYSRAVRVGDATPIGAETQAAADARTLRDSFNDASRGMLLNSVGAELPEAVQITTVTPANQPAEELYLNYAVESGHVPTLSISLNGQLNTTYAPFASHQGTPWRLDTETATVVTINTIDPALHLVTQLSTAATDNTAAAAVNQLVNTINQHQGQGFFAELLDSTFNPGITPVSPVLRIDQAGEHAFINRPVITINHPTDADAGNLSVEDFARGAFDTIGQEGGLFDPNEYYTKTQTDAKIAAIEAIASDGTVVAANPGGGETLPSVPDLTTVTIAGVSYNIKDLDAGNITETQLASSSVFQPALLDLYPTGAEVIYEGVFYERKISTASPILSPADSTFVNDESTHWTRVGGVDSGHAWHIGGHYIPGDLVDSGNILFIAIKESGAGTTAGAKDPANRLFVHHGVDAVGADDFWQIVEASLEIGSAATVGATPTAHGNASELVFLNTDITASNVTDTSSDRSYVGLADTAVTAGSYTNASITVDSKGRITTASTGRQGFADWIVGTDYTVGDIILTSIGTLQFLWRCEVAHTSDSTAGGAGDGEPRFNVLNTNWSQIGPVPIVQWITGFNYAIGDTVLYTDTTTPANSGVFQRLIGGSDASSSDNPAANTGDWVRLSGGGSILSGAQFPDVADHTAGDLFILTAGHTQPADDDLIYLGLYVLVENTGTNEWVHLTEYKTTEVSLAYPSGTRNQSFYGNKGVQDLAQDLIDTTALVYTEMNTALAAKQNITADWKVNTAYQVNDEVYVPLGAETLLWRCDVAHTSSSTTGDGTGTSRPRFNVDNTNWTVIGFNDIHTWTAGFTYGIGDIVTYVDTVDLTNSGIYQCILGNAGNSPPNATYWTLLNARINVFSGNTEVSNSETTGISFTVGSGTASGLQVADAGANVGVRIGIPTGGTVPSSWDDKQDNLTVTVGSSGAVWTPATSTLNLSGVTSGASAGVTAIFAGFVPGSIQGGGNASWSTSTGLQFNSTTEPGSASAYQLGFSWIGTTIFQFEGSDVVKTGNTWVIAPADITIVSGNTPPDGQDLAYFAALTRVATGITGDVEFTGNVIRDGNVLNFGSGVDTAIALNSEFTAASVSDITPTNGVFNTTTGVIFTEATAPTENSIYRLTFTHANGTGTFEFNGSNVEFLNNTWNIQPGRYTITGDTPFNTNTLTYTTGTGAAAAGGGVTFSGGGVTRTGNNFNFTSENDTRLGFNLISGDLTTLADYTPPLVSYNSASQELKIFALPTSTTLQAGVNYEVNVTLGTTYTGNITFTSEQATGGSSLTIAMNEATSVPQFNLNTSSGNITGPHQVLFTSGDEIITFDGHGGDIVFQGTGVSRSDDGQTFTFNAIVDADSLEAFFAADDEAGRGVSYSVVDGLIETTVAADTTKQDLITAGNAEAVRGALNVVPGAHTHLGSSVTADAFVTVSTLLSPYGLTGTTFYITNVPIGVNATSNYRVEVSDDDAYTGVATFTGAAVTITAGNWLIDSTHSSFTATPALPTSDFVATSNQMVVIQEEQSVTTFTGVAGEINFVGDGVSRDGQAFTFDTANKLKYALLLTNGFLLPENSAMSTDDRDAYTDTLGVYGTANQVYWFDNTNDGWFDVATGGTALISFPA